MKIIWNEVKRKCNISDESFEELIQNPMSSLSQADKDFIISAYNNNKFSFVVEYVYNKTIKIIQSAVFSVGEDMVVSLTHRLGRKFISAFFDVFVLRLATEFGLVSKKEEVVMLEIIEALQKKHTGEEEGEYYTISKEKTKYFVVHMCEAVLLKDFSPFTESIKNTLESITSEEILPYQDSYNDIVESSCKNRNLLIRMIVAILNNPLPDQKKMKILCQNAKNLFPFIWDCVTINDKKFFSYSIKSSSENSVVRSVFNELSGQIKMIDFNTDLSVASKLLNNCQSALDSHYSVGNRREEVASLMRIEEISFYPNLFLRSVITPALVAYLDGICGVNAESKEVAERILSSINIEKWTYYFKTFFEKDDFVLINLATRDNCLKEWCNIIRKLNFNLDEFQGSVVYDLLVASKKQDFDLVKVLANKMFFE